ncbi:MAG: hypothetical protein JWO16_578 [Sphingomonas bacterium]|nr:hypothetical protein [Sphingomonas bacterium]
MFTLFSCLPRHPSLSREQFHDHWRHPHATLASRVPVITSYTQNHQIDCAALDGSQHVFDGVAESRRDRVEDVDSVMLHPVFQAEVAPDRGFMDVDAIRGVVVSGELVASTNADDPRLSNADRYWSEADRPLCIKLLQFIEACDEDWRSDDDLEMGLAIGALKHGRYDPVASYYRDRSPPFLGVRELRWPTLSAFNRGTQASSNIFKQLIGRPTAAIALLVQSERVLP